MKVFVTGGCGFIGRHVANTLLSSGHTVVAYDNLRNSPSSIASELEKKGVKVIKGDIQDHKSLSKSVIDCDVAIHLAAQIDVQESIKDPQTTNLVNVTGSVNLFQACVQQGIKNIISASTAAVYGDSKKQPISENFQANPISPYGASKLAMEYYAKAFANCYDLNCISLRFFNVYGNGQSDAYAGVITRFMNRIKDNKPLTIYGDGTYTRDFVSIKDVVNAIQASIKRIKNKRGNTYNIASGKYTTIKTLAEMMISISGKPLSIKFTKTKKGDIAKSQPTIKLAQKELGYKPETGLKEGLSELLMSS